MSKKLLRALALNASTAAFPAAVFAQSSVALYGIVDAGVEYTNHAAPEGGSSARLRSGNKNTSRWGLRGVEDLGSGLKATFRLESGIDIANGRLDDGPNALFGRRATVGLKGAWGELTLGRTFTPTFDYVLDFDPMGYAPNYSWVVASTATGGRRDIMFVRSSNALRYDGKFGGFDLGTLYGFGNMPGSLSAGAKYDLALKYERGPFAAVATFDRQKGAGSSVLPPDSVDYIQSVHAGVSYDFGQWKILAGYRNYRRTFVTTAANQLSDMYWIGALYRFTPTFSLTGAIYHQDIKGSTDADPTLFTVRALYSLSKRTVIYGAGAFAVARHGQNVSVSRDIAGYASTQVGCTVGIQQRF